MEKIILNRIKSYTKQIDAMFKEIKKYDRICVFRHQHPDYDALGSQMAMVHFLKENFKDKEIRYVGDDHVSLTGKCFPKMEVLKDSWFEKPFLAIILDLSTFDRIGDERANKATSTIKIDHHPEVDKYGNVQIVDTSMIAVGELLAAIFIYEEKYNINKECAANLYKAIVGDSGRFLYSDTTAHTFFVAQRLIEKGIDINKIYSEMYDESITDLEVRKYILKTYKLTKHGVAYYILSDKELKRFNLKPIQGKDNVNLFAHFKGINAWMSCTEEKDKKDWKISIRSAKKSIEEIAMKYNGGGHAQASGCKVKDLKEFQKLVNDLDKLFK